MRLWTGCSSWVSTSVSPGGCEICCFLLSSQQVHCTDLLFWPLRMQAQWYCCAGICPCLYWLFSFFGHVRPNSSRRGQEPPIFVLFFIDDKSASYFPDSCQVNPQTISHQPQLPVTLPSVCCCLGSRASARTRSRSYASAACWWCQRTSSCTGVGAGSTRRGRRLLCCKLSTWRQFPSGGW